MKTYCLLELFPASSAGTYTPQSGNRVIAECQALTQTAAAKQLSAQSPVPLDNEGYAKAGELSYCIAEQFSTK